MGQGNAVWGIDVGNCSLKAMRCYEDDSDPTKLVVDAVDYIEYPMILTQADANPAELVSDALKQFLSRNKIKGDKIAISIAGQNGLVRFIKLPPIEPKKVPDIVKYEAKQQIPFDLNDVIWGYQRLGQAAQDQGFPLEVEIGLFAMKRDQVFHILEPYESASIPVDCVQLAPLALYNYMMADEMHDLPSMEDYDPENPPPYVVVLSMGTDATDLILTNGFRVWQRNLPIGGNNFTKALMKELKLTFAKADHLKRNLATSQDKVAVLKAMQPVFHSFHNEIQRSLGYHSSLDPNAQYERVIALGNAMKLTGLTNYLSKNLGVAVNLGNSYRGLNTSNLADSPTVQENLPTFGICYGLCLQALKRSAVQTNLLPGEIRTARIINSKKPWMVTAVSLMMLGAAINYGANYSIQDTVKDSQWDSAIAQANSLSTTASEQTEKAKAADTALEEVRVLGQNLVTDSEKRLLWLELVRGINECLPTPPPIDSNSVPTKESISSREELHVRNIEAQPLDDAAAEQWLEKVVKEDWLTIPKELKTENEEEQIAKLLAPAPIPGLEGAEGEEGAEAAPVASTSEDGEEGESEGLPRRWLVSVSGVHYHNGTEFTGAEQFVRDTFIKNLREKEITIPRFAVLTTAAQTQLVDLSGDMEDSEDSEDVSADGDETAAENEETKVVKKPVYEEDMATEETVTMADLGVRYPVLLDRSRKRMVTISNPYSKKSDRANPGMMGGPEYMGAGAGMMPDAAAPGGVVDPANPDGTARPLDETIKVEECSFEVHFIWEPRLPSERERIRKAQLEAERRAEEAAAAEEQASEDEEGDDDGESAEE